MAVAEKDFANLSLPELKSYYEHLSDRKAEINKILVQCAKRGKTNSSEYKKHKEELDNLIDILNQVSAWIRRKS